MLLHSGSSFHDHDILSQRRASLEQYRRPFLHSSLRSILKTGSGLTGSATQGFEVALTNNKSSFSPHHYSDSSFQPQHISKTVDKKTPVVRFEGMPPENMPARHSIASSEDEESLAGSELSERSTLTSSTRRKRSKRSPRVSTRFALAHPAPQLRTKQRKLVQIRPRLLLQLQRLGEKRAVPAYEAIPSSLVAGSILIPHLAKTFPWVFRAKRNLGQNDLLIVRSEDYSENHASNTQDGDVARGDVLGVISSSTRPSVNCVDIALEDGSVWEANLMANGSYEFTSNSDDGSTTVARWVKRSVRHSTGTVDLRSASGRPGEEKWTFSIIDPTTRRHPIMGVLNSTTLEIFNVYNTMSSSSGRFPPTRAFGPPISGWAHPSVSSSLGLEERSSVLVTEEEKRLMVATGIWISLHKEGWPASSSPKYSRASGHCRSASSDQADRAKSFPLDNVVGAESRRSTPSPRISRLADETKSPRTSQEVNHKRAMSTGATYMARRQSTVRSKDHNVRSDPSKQRHLSRRDQYDYQEAEEKTTCGLGIRALARKMFARNHAKGARGKLSKRDKAE